MAPDGPEFDHAYYLPVGVPNPTSIDMFTIPENWDGTWESLIADPGNDDE